MPPLSAPPKRMLPSSPHAPPAKIPASPSGTTAPPSTEILLNLVVDKNPTHWLSGEKNGQEAPSVPGSSVAFA